MRYVYACYNPEHEKIEVEHSMKSNPDIRCVDCDQLMHRIPQTFTWGHNPGQVLLQKMHERSRILKIKRQMEKRNGKRIRG